jgi:Mrp family chromosome partitioning ATPase
VLASRDYLLPSHTVGGQRRIPNPAIRHQGSLDMTIPVVDRTALRRTIAVLNGKGGVGKTSLTANLSGLFADAGYRVLAIDLDPQA